MPSDWACLINIISLGRPMVEPFLNLDFDGVVFLRYPYSYAMSCLVFEYEEEFDFV